MKEIKISEVLNYLKNGVTRWDKENVGFGSLEKIYDLTSTEMKELMDHPKIKGVRTKIPTFRIIDDTEETQEEATVETSAPAETRIFVQEPVAPIRVPSSTPKKVAEPFI